MQPSSPLPVPRRSPFTLGRFLRVFPALLMLGVLLVVSQMATSHSAGARYRECSALAASDPARAMQAAHAWREKDPESPVAGHCEAIALYASGDYPHAAVMLEALTKNASARNSPLAADLALQASLADQAAGQNPKALEILSATLDHGGSSVQTGDKVLLLSERAKLYRAMGRPLLAVQDLDDALSLDPANGDVKALIAETTRKTKAFPAILPEK